MSVRKNIGFAAIFAVTGWLGMTYWLNTRAADELAVNIDDIRESVRWESTRNKSAQLGIVRGSVIDACSDLPNKIDRYRHTWIIDRPTIEEYRSMCPLAIRGALHFYSTLGGAFGCAQVRRALAIYPNLGDEASLSATEKCLATKKGE